MNYWQTKSFHFSVAPPRLLPNDQAAVVSLGSKAHIVFNWGDYSDCNQSDLNSCFGTEVNISDHHGCTLRLNTSGLVTLTTQITKDNFVDILGTCTDSPGHRSPSWTATVQLGLIEGQKKVTLEIVAAEPKDRSGKPLSEKCPDYLGIAKAHDKIGFDTPPPHTHTP